MQRGILVQRSTNPHLIIVGGKLAEDPAQMGLPEYDHVVKTFSPDRADQSLRVPILPRRACSDQPVADAQGSQSACDCSTVDRVLIADRSITSSSRSARPAQPDQATRGVRFCSSTSCAVRGAAGNCSTVACWPSRSELTSTTCPSGNSSAS
jgi:hypothetical protein